MNKQDPFEKLKYVASKVVRKAYSELELSEADNASRNMCAKLNAQVLFSGSSIGTFDGHVYPNTGKHNVCVRIAHVNDSFTTDIFIEGSTVDETCKVAAKTGLAALARQRRNLGKNCSGNAMVVVYILGEYDYEEKKFVTAAEYLTPAACVNVELTGEGSRFTPNF